MEMKSTTNKNKNQTEDCDLDDRYGEIGISAVAAAVRCRAEEPAVNRRRHRPYDSD